MLKTPSLYKFDSARYYGFFNNLVSLLDRYPTSELEPHLGPLRAMLKRLDEGYMLDRSNMLTLAVKAADERRDQAFMGLKRWAEAFEFHFEAKMREAAQLLLRNFKKYGTLHRLPYAEQSAALDSLLKDWEAEDLQKAIETLGMAAWVAELREAARAFDDFYLDRVTSDASKTAVPISKLRAEANKIYQDFAVLLAAFAQIQAETHLPLVQQVNELVRKYEDFNRQPNAEGDIEG